MKPKIIPFTQEQLHKLLEEKEPGILYWRTTGRGRSDIAKPAGCIRKLGYWNICIDNIRYSRHRLIFFIHTGEQPDVIDHISGVENGDAIANLQKSNGSHNQHKRRMPKNNKSGFVGVYWDKNRKKWLAKIMANRKHIHIGRFDDKNEAHEAYLAAKDLYHGGERALV